jgi:hypothetical protein
VLRMECPGCATIAFKRRLTGATCSGRKEKDGVTTVSAMPWSWVLVSATWWVCCG